MSRHVMAFFASLCFMVMILAAGFGLCMIPKTTEILATYTDAANTSSPFSSSQLVQAAVATLDYTMYSHDYNAVMDVIQRINIDTETPYANVSIEELALAEDIYTLTPDALSHLDDCFAVVNVARAFIIVFAVVGIVLAIILLTKKTDGRRSLGRAMRWAAGLFTVALIALAVLAALDFNAFFSAFHGIFFPQGNWTFSANSLLISMYPINFWIGMGIIWVVGSLVMALIVFALGTAIKPGKAK